MGFCIHGFYYIAAGNSIIHVEQMSSFRNVMNGTGLLVLRPRFREGLSESGVQRSLESLAGGNLAFPISSIFFRVLFCSMTSIFDLTP